MPFYVDNVYRKLREGQNFYVTNLKTLCCKQTKLDTTSLDYSKFVGSERDYINLPSI